MAMTPGNGSAPERLHSKVQRWAGRGKVFVDRIQALKRRLSIVGRRYIFLLFVGCIVLLAWYIPRRFPGWHLRIAAVLWENLFFVSILLVVLLFSLLRWLLWKLPKQQVEGIDCEKDRLTAESGFRQPLIQIVQTLVQVVGGTALLGGLYFTAETLRTSQDTLRVNQKTLETTQQGQITERFTRAIEQLGDKERLMVRLGGIYALERIARDSASDHWVVMEVLMAFVREQAPAKTIPPNNTSEERDTQESPPEQKLPLDIQAILTVIGRRIQNGERHRVDLHSSTVFMG
jgi:hypothetical protein